MSQAQAKPTNIKLPLANFMKWLLYLVTIFLVSLTVIFGSSFIYAQSFAGRFFPRIKINGQNVANFKPEPTVKALQEQIDDFLANGLTYVFENQTINVPLAAPPSADVDLSYNLATFNAQQTIDQAYTIGRNNGYYKNFLSQAKVLLFGANVPLAYEFNREQFLKTLKDNFANLAQAKAEARPLIDKNLKIDILPEQSGTVFDYPAILKQSLARINSLNSEPIALKEIKEEPVVKKSEITPELIERLKNLIKEKSLTLTYQKEEWPVAQDILKDWLVFVKEEGQIAISLNPAMIASYLEKELAPQINRPALDAKFSLKNGRVTEFQGGQDGLTLNIQASAEKTKQALLKENQAQAEMIVGETKAKIGVGSINDLGIAEIIGTGRSNFKGSPNNRRHNIKVGADALNGILIKPGETFSLVEALGEIDALHGYLPELVIKGDRTIPEYGGGLCQIGTTVFRAALAAGLPIVERKNHSYRVVYYEPAGKDATIYNPKPDFKFLNDTGHYILIQSRLNGDELSFDFWGAKDGRLAEQTDSVIYNIRSPGPTQYIESEELKPGEEKCLEKPHSGADAYFDYKVTYPNGEIKEQRFSSHYIPWPAKCLIGKQVSADTPTTTAPAVE